MVLAAVRARRRPSSVRATSCHTQLRSVAQPLTMVKVTSVEQSKGKKDKDKSKKDKVKKDKKDKDPKDKKDKLTRE